MKQLCQVEACVWWAAVKKHKQGIPPFCNLPPHSRTHTCTCKIICNTHAAFALRNMHCSPVAAAADGLNHLATSNSFHHMPYIWRFLCKEPFFSPFFSSGEVVALFIARRSGNAPQEDIFWEGVVKRLSFSSRLKVRRVEIKNYLNCSEKALQLQAWVFLGIFFSISKGLLTPPRVKISYGVLCDSVQLDLSPAKSHNFNKHYGDATKIAENDVLHYMNAEEII